jgi:hypothetical protein
VEALLGEGRRAGEVPRALPLAAIAAHVVGAAIGIAAQALLSPGAVDAEACVREAARAVAARLEPRPRRRARSG